MREFTDFIANQLASFIAWVIGLALRGGFVFILLWLMPDVGGEGGRAAKPIAELTVADLQVAVIVPIITLACIFAILFGFPRPEK